MCGSLYLTLNVASNCSQADIERQYKSLVLSSYPFSSKESDMIADVSYAYSVLRNPRTRYFYDLFGEQGLELGDTPDRLYLMTSFVDRINVFFVNVGFCGFLAVIWLIPGIFTLNDMFGLQIRLSFACLVLFVSFFSFFIVCLSFLISIYSCSRVYCDVYRMVVSSFCKGWLIFLQFFVLCLRYDGLYFFRDDVVGFFAVFFVVLRIFDNFSDLWVHLEDAGYWGVDKLWVMMFCELLVPIFYILQVFVKYCGFFFVLPLVEFFLLLNFVFSCGSRECLGLFYGFSMFLISCLPVSKRVVLYPLKVLSFLGLLSLFLLYSAAKNLLMKFSPLYFPALPLS